MGNGDKMRTDNVMFVQSLYLDWITPAIILQCSVSDRSISTVGNSI